MREKEKHPVDELFASRLQDAERTPSAGAWDTLQTRMTKKKRNRPLAMWYGVAASVAVLVGCFVWFRLDNGTDANNSVAQKVQPKTENSIPADTQTSVASPDSDSTPEKQAEQSVHPLPQPEAVIINPAIASVKKSEKMTQPAVSQNPVVNPKKTIGQEAPKVEEIVAQAPVPETETKTQPAVSEQVTVVVVEIPTAETAVETEPAALRSQPKGRKAEKIWNTLKKVKKGEVNIDKDALFAWVREKGGKHNQP